MCNTASLREIAKLFFKAVCFYVAIQQLEKSTLLGNDSMPQKGLIQHCFPAFSWINSCFFYQFLFIPVIWTLNLENTFLKYRYFVQRCKNFSQTCRMKLFTKSFILDFLLGSEFACVVCLHPSSVFRDRLHFQ